MKKILASLLVVALCAPAMAVQFGLIGNTDGTATITIDTEGAVVRGVAIKVTAAGGLTDVNGATVNPAFNTYIDYAHDAGAAYTAVGQGHPFAADGAAGVAVNGATTFVISMGVLDQGGNQAGFNGAGDLITFPVGDGEVCIAADTLRGPDSGVVGDTALTSNIASVACVTVSSGPTECVKATAPFYAAWVAWGKPNCWCYKKQCRGDVDGASQLGRPVSNNDLTKFKEAFNKTDAQLQAVVNGICADLDHAAQLGRRVSNNDLQTFKLYFN
ncbi:MAG TPA: hypothetical protein PKV53_12435, partial [Anaerohalosphaeraceae bacterium]|nr:hypothetical protein [Anaerohalosphaeraceae bacterium]